ncbi:MAG: hypothetical protein ACRD7E_07015 [Bryobacteraceae bacterium]
MKHAVGIALNDAAGWQQMLEQALEQTGGPITKSERAWAAILSPRRQKRGPDLKRIDPALELVVV